MRSAVVATAVCLSLIAIASAGNASASMRKSVDIAAQPLGTALKQLAQDRGLQVLYFSDTVRSLKTRGASGDLTTDEAFDQLLEGTGLTHEFIDDNTVNVFPLMTNPATGSSLQKDTAESSAAATLDAPTSLWDSFRLAQADQGVAGGAGIVGETSSSSEPVKLDEVVVTAQKREERLIDVPISIVAISGDELQRRQITSFNDLMFAVPDLSVWDEGTQRRIMLRGIANEQGQSSSIGLYLDEAAVTSQTFSQPELNTYDLERVEVLRGPQGTLFGEGSLGGTVRFITKNPVLDKFGFNADVAALYTEDGAPGQRINTMVNMPVINDVLGVRIVGSFDHEGGWIDQPAADRKDINDQNLADVRAKVLWHPVEQVTATGMAEIHHNDRGTNDGEDANGNFTQDFNLTTTPRIVEDFDIYNLKLTDDVGRIRILSTTTYVHQYEHQTDFGYGFTGSAPPAPVSQIYFPLQNTKINNVNQELRLTSTGSGPWQWTLGGFYKQFRYDVVIPPWFYGLPGPLPAQAEPYYELKYTSHSWAAFADTSYQLTDRFTLTAGIRGFQDHQVYTPPYTTLSQTGTFHSKASYRVLPSVSECR